MLRSTYFRAILVDNARRWDHLARDREDVLVDRHPGVLHIVRVGVVEELHQGERFNGLWDDIQTTRRVLTPSLMATSMSRRRRFGSCTASSMNFRWTSAGSLRLYTCPGSTMQNSTGTMDVCPMRTPTYSGFCTVRFHLDWKCRYEEDHATGIVTDSAQA